jgi:hypothetical protein
VYVFINGTQVPYSLCNLGGLHSALLCSFSLSQLNLVVNTTYTMVVLRKLRQRILDPSLNCTECTVFLAADAERQTTQSNFMLTTSILPLDTPPTVSNLNVTMSENSLAYRVDVPAAASQAGQILNFLVLQAPVYGSLSFVTPDGTLHSAVGMWQNSSTYYYTPSPYFCGSDSFTFLAGDGTLNSSSTGTVSMQVQFQNSMFSILTLKPTDLL